MHTGRHRISRASARACCVTLAMSLLLPWSASAAQGGPAFPEPGLYLLTMTAAIPAPTRELSAADAPTAPASGAPRSTELRLLLARTRDAITLSEGGVVVLRGAVHGEEISLEGGRGKGTLAIRLRSADNVALATGSFTANPAHGPVLHGAAQLVPAPATAPRAETRRGCSGFWDCVKLITGYDWEARP